MRRLDLTGERFGRLTALKLTGRKNSSGKLEWECKCDCGEIANVASGQLRSGKTKSCGCLQSDNRIKHGHTQSNTYSSWRCMKCRCLNPNHSHFEYYGGRGVTICDRWKNSFKSFLEDMGEAPAGLTLDRIDNSKGYEPGNCRWATPKEQSNNTRRTIFVFRNGEKLPLAIAAEKEGISYSLARFRFQRA